VVLRAVRVSGRSDPRRLVGVAGNVARELMRERRSRFPGFVEAVVADAKVTAAFRGERAQFRGGLDTLGQVLRLCAVADAFLAQVCYRAKASMQVRGVRGLPRLFHRLAMVLAQVSIGNPVIVGPGLYLLHGQVVIDGLTEIGGGVIIAPSSPSGWSRRISSGPRSGRAHGSAPARRCWARSRSAPTQ
jgi:hypothetical protein